MHRSHLSHPPRTAASPLGALPGSAPDSSQARPDAAAAVWPCVPDPASATTLTEVDVRSVGANFGRVALYLALGPTTEHYLVRIETDDGEPVVTIAAETRVDALDAYRHPFARPGVPDIFSEAA
jgi:hypothetical protein